MKFEVFDFELKRLKDLSVISLEKIILFIPCQLITVNCSLLTVH